MVVDCILTVTGAHSHLQTCGRKSPSTQFSFHSEVELGEILNMY